MLIFSLTDNICFLKMLPQARTETRRRILWKILLKNRLRWKREGGVEVDREYNLIMSRESGGHRRGSKQPCVSRLDVTGNGNLKMWMSLLPQITRKGVQV